MKSHCLVQSAIIAWQAFTGEGVMTRSAVSPHVVGPVESFGGGKSQIGGDEVAARITTAKFYRQELRNFQDMQYFADFEVGGQTIAGIFDTGSFELLVRSTRCDACVHPTPAYNYHESATYRSNGTVAQHVYGSGPCVSVMGYENVTVGPFQSPNQAFWEILNHSIAVLNTASFAAIVGIGPNFAEGATEETLLTAYGVEEFSICLQKPAGASGYLTWGSTGDNKSESGLATIDVVGKHHWVAHLANVTFLPINLSAPHLAQVPCSSGCAAILDSGTSLIAAPTRELMLLSSQIESIMEDCSNLDSLPTLRFNVGGHDLELPPRAYVMRVRGAVLEANDIWDILFFKPKIRKVDMCMPAFMQMDMVSQFGPVWILGMPFFRYYHTTFDRTRRAMHVGRAGPNCEQLPIESNETSLLALDRKADYQPMIVNIESLIPPTLSEMADRSAMMHMDL